MSVKIYFAVPLIANRDLEKARQIAGILEKLGCEIISKWVLDSSLSPAYTARSIYERDTSWVNNCELIVAEVSKPSHGVGMEIMLAHTLGKKVICIYEKNTTLSNLIRGMPGAVLVEYSSFSDLEEKLSMAII